MFKLTISNMQNREVRSFEFVDFKTARSRFFEHMDANNLVVFDCDYSHDEWLENPLTTGEFSIAVAGGPGHDVRIELVAIKSFAQVHANSMANIGIIEDKLREIGARHIGRNDDGVGAFIPTLDFWQFENRIFMIRETRSSIHGHRFELYCSMEFPTLDSAINQIENICRIQHFMK